MFGSHIGDYWSSETIIYNSNIYDLNFQNKTYRVVPQKTLRLVKSKYNGDNQRPHSEHSRLSSLIKLTLLLDTSYAAYNTMWKLFPMARKDKSDLLPSTHKNRYEFPHFPFPIFLSYVVNKLKRLIKRTHESPSLPFPWVSTT